MVQEFKTNTIICYFKPVSYTILIVIWRVLVTWLLQLSISYFSSLALLIQIPIEIYYFLIL